MRIKVGMIIVANQSERGFSLFLKNLTITRKKRGQMTFMVSQQYSFAGLIEGMSFSSKDSWIMI